jgi:hypothetical protein
MDNVRKADASDSGTRRIISRVAFEMVTKLCDFFLKAQPRDQLLNQETDYFFLKNFIF